MTRTRSVRPSLPNPGWIALAALSACLGATPLAAQPRDDGWSYVLSIGDSRLTRGLRLNLRDRQMERVQGVNLTMWTPYRDSERGEVAGIALGIPGTGAGSIYGLGVGLIALASERDLRGIGVAGVGLGGGRRLSGLLVGGIGVGGGAEISGLAVGGVGVGAGEDLSGIAIGGVGVGAGQSARGLLAGGVGAGVGGNLTGIGIGGVGLGVGEDAVGLLVGGLGAGVGGNFTGIGVGGIGIGVGGVTRGLCVGGFGVGGDDLRGVLLGGTTVQGGSLTGLAAAAAFIQIDAEAEQRGVAVSAFNRMRGLQRGLTIGVLNYAADLNGIQIGVLNIARSNRPGLRVLPLANWSMRGRN